MLLVLFSVSAHSMCTHENNVSSCLLSKWLCGNSSTGADDVRLPIAGTNEPTMTTLHICIYIYTYPSASLCTDTPSKPGRSNFFCLPR